MKQKTYWKSLRLECEKIVSDYDSSEWTIGNFRNNPYPVVKECEGLNCSSHIVDTMYYVPGDVLSEVMVRGKTIVGITKITAQEMKIVRAWEWTEKDSVALAIYAAESAIGYYEDEYPNDNGPREAINAAKKWLSNPTEVKLFEIDVSIDVDYLSAAHSAYSAYLSADSAYSTARVASYATDNYTYTTPRASRYSPPAVVATYALGAIFSAIDAHVYATKENKKNACEDMKSNFDAWIVEHLKTKELL